MSVYRELGIRIRDTRREAGLTQSSLGEKTGISQSSLSQFETGHSEALSDEKLELLCSELGICFDDYRVSGADGVSWGKICFCPTTGCPSNVAYVISGEAELRFSAQPVQGLDEGDRYCRFCGGLVLFRCDACGAAPRLPGGHCPACGSPYIPPLSGPEARTELSEIAAKYNSSREAVGSGGR